MIRARSFITDQSKTTGTSTTKYDCPDCKDSLWIHHGGNNFKPCPCRELKQAKQIIEKSGISDAFNSKTIRDYTAKDESQRRARGIAIEYIQSFEDLRNERNNSIMLLGQSGCGKTHLTIAIANALLKAGIAVRYMQYREAMTAIKQVMNDDIGYTRIMNPWKNTPVLLIDDLYKGVLRNGKANESEISIMFDLINHRYLAQKPIMVSSEYLLNQIIDFDEATGTRISEMARGRTIEFIGKELNHRMA